MDDPLILSTEGVNLSKNAPLELRVGVDVGCHSHNVAIGLSSGEILDEFDMSHNPVFTFSSHASKSNSENTIAP